MERGWIDTVQLLGLDIALLVIVVLVALSAVALRLAMDPAESALPALLARLRALRSSVGAPSARDATPGIAEPVAAELKPETVTAEWLDRLLSRDPRRDTPASRSAATQPNAPSEEQEVA